MIGSVSDDFLLAIAGIAATLMGLLLVGVLFFVETGLRQLDHVGLGAAPYLRAGARFVLALYSLVLGLALGLVVFEPGWVAIAFAPAGLATLATLVAFTRHARRLARERPDWLHPISAWLPWPPALLALGLPWAIGGFSPDREAFVPTLLLTGGLALIATASLVLVTFELAAVGTPGRSAASPAEGVDDDPKPDDASACGP